MGDTEKPIYCKFYLEPYLNVVLEKEIVPNFKFETYNVEHDLGKRIT